MNPSLCAFRTRLYDKTILCPIPYNIFTTELRPLVSEFEPLFEVKNNKHPKLFSSVLETKNLFLINNIKDKDFYGTAKVRYRQKDQECKITKKGDTLRIEFSLPQRAVTPGQSVVIYKDDVCLGGGEISEIN